MKVKLKARALWSVIEDGGTDQQEEMMALDALCGAVPPEMVPTITKKDTAKEAWDAITVEDYVLRLSGMAAHLSTLSEEVKNDENRATQVISSSASRVISSAALLVGGSP
jgi:hypothetical protein